MDTPGTESGLDLNGAAAAIANVLDPQPEPTEDERAVKIASEEVQPDPVAEESEHGTDGIIVEVDGKEVQLTKEQIADAYKNGLRQSDYTRKTMEVAEQRKATEAEAQRYQAERSDYAQKLNNYAIQLQGMLEQQSQINWQQLLESDPVEYLKQQRIYTDRQAAFQQARQDQFNLHQQLQAEQASHVQRFLSDQQQQLVAKLPDWKDGAKATAEKKQIAEYLIREGHDPQKVNAISDHNDVIAYRKAMLYDALMVKAKSASQKVQTLPTRVERPGNGEVKATDGRSRAMQRLSRSGSIDDAAAAFATLL